MYRTEQDSINLKGRKWYVVLCIMIMIGTSSGVFANHANAASPTEIHSAADLDNVRNDLSGDYVLKNDIDLSGYSNWEPIGDGSTFSRFEGTFDGEGHTISGLTITRPTEDNVGLFGYIQSSAEIKNVILTGVNVEGKENVGGLVGQVWRSNVANVTVQGNVKGTVRVGGVSGELYGHSGTASMIEGSTMSGTVTGERDVGGLIGYTRQSEVMTSHANSAVTGDRNVGGLVGFVIEGPVSESYATGAVTGINRNLGGLVGSINGGSVNISYATGSVTGSSTASHVGGLIGHPNSSAVTIENTFATGDVQGNYYVGGLLGGTIGYTFNIRNNYAVGSVTGSGGGLIGYNSNSYGTVENNFYDQSTTGKSDTGNGEPKDTSEMLEQSTYTGWDFSSIWGINAGEYPHLQFNPHSTVPPVVNEAPVINATDTTITVGDTYDPLAGVSATDAEDGDVTGNINVTTNDVDTSTPGAYDVVYEVTDSDGKTTTKTITITVEAAASTNEAPVINAANKTITVGDMYDPLSGVTATDAEDGDVTGNINVTTNDVDTTTPGAYDVVYEVTDSAGETTTKTITVTVEAATSTNEAPVINATDTTITVGDTYDPLAGVTATDAEDGDVTGNINVTTNDVDTTTPGAYDVVYEVTDSDGETTTKTITVTVEAATSTNEAPVINATDTTITVGDTYDPLAGVSATDAEDGDVTGNINVTTNDVDTSTPGAYDVVYEVTDSDGKTTTKTVTITVEATASTNEAPVINAADKTITVGDTYDPLAGVTATDAEDGDVTGNINVTTNDVDTTTPGAYDVVYEVTDSDGKTTTKTITVTVEASSETIIVEENSDLKDESNDEVSKSGNELPHTSTSNYNWILVGMILIGLAIVLRIFYSYRKNA
ncbi:immunoglobulin-like domain-containing protein [Virgibacillus sp. W0181]|uniref:immunoglobulin-like domain-containing protein n=1 Tax=Virgibacillus sp. W0181 TaxID=3391581 RepID=UPI003F4847EF